jgi:hypothetical protein
MAVGQNYPAIQDILKYVVDKGKSQVASKDKVGENLYNRAVRTDSAFFPINDKAPKLFTPYMKLTQKNTPFWRPLHKTQNPLRPPRDTRQEQGTFLPVSDTVR